MTEANLMRKIQMYVTELGHRLFRNNVGVGYQGKAIEYKQRGSVAVYPGDVLIRQARRVRYGLCKGSSDLLGWTTVTIEHKHLGMRLAIFTAIEVKTQSGRLSKEQRDFLTAVKSQGGIAGIARGTEDAAEIIEV
jgi:hypothetical protein